jgi:hypothetical protein
VEWRRLCHREVCYFQVTDVFGMQMQRSGILYVSDLLYIAHFARDKYISEHFLNSLSFVSFLQSS